LVDPDLPVYPSNTLVTLRAVPEPGWSLLSWTGTEQATSQSVSLRMDGNKAISAIFGTLVLTAAVSNGSLGLAPASGPYPYGSTLTVKATPDAGYFFAIWGDAARGRQNPLVYSVTSPNPRISALFLPLNTNQFTLAAGVSGEGRIIVEPSTNVFQYGTTISVLAVPSTNWEFAGWTGDFIGIQNPLRLTVFSDIRLEAKFLASSRLRLSMFNGLWLEGIIGQNYSIQSTMDLDDINSWVTLTNINLTTAVQLWTDPRSTNATRQFYRALQIP
jgi:hypothetical protein